jgi:subtilisin family serine protease
LGTPYDSPLLREAMTKLKAAGIVSVAAAGNSGGSVEYPAAYPEVIAVSATDTNDLLASWSNRGPEIDLAAPGVEIYSTYKGSTYKTLSGTSMAAPHVTGAAALLLNTPITTEWDNNGNGQWDPEEIQDRLQKTAIDLGQPGFDPLYGWGLVNIAQAISR